jgi:hypothetical protein
MTEDVTFSLLDCPPSLNALGSRGSNMEWYRTKRRWQTDLGVWLMASGLPRDLLRVRAYATMRFPVKRRRDVDNFEHFLKKSLGDALTEGRYIADDDAAGVYRFEELRFEDELGPKRTTVTLLYEAKRT